VAKPVKIRDFYTEDAQYMLRLQKAVRGDNRPGEWKKNVIKKLGELSQLLIGAPPKNGTKNRS
jgi:hypothetical protein